MLVSTQHKFIFLSNRKCGSTALTAALAGHCSMVLRRDFRLRHTSYAQLQEFMLPFLKNQIGKEVETYPVYCMMREPTEWASSWYRFRSRDKIANPAHPNHDAYTGNMSWQDFLAEMQKKQPAKYAAIGRQKSFVVGLDGTTRGLDLYRYEDYNAFVDMISDRIGKPLQLARRNVSPKGSGGISDADYQIGRQVMAADYAIYDALPKRD